jgi:hypothetical protein
MIKRAYFTHHSQERDAEILTTSSNVQLLIANFKNGKGDHNLFIVCQLVL